MEEENPNLFEEFDEAPRDPAKAAALTEVVVRPAETRDVHAIGRISAEREGEDVDKHTAGCRRELEGGEAGRSLLVLVAELDGNVIGFGKARYIAEKDAAEAGASPGGWYLTGVVVDPRFRRRGVGSRLTVERLRWIAERSRFAYYFSNARNRVSIALHDRFGFTEMARGARLVGESFAGGEGILFRLDLARSPWRAP
jgi:ribosomal protein S18 acetylase RimI-like enzyme